MAVASYVLLFTFYGTAAQATTADADFQARCSAPGVIRCYGFDDPADLAKFTYLGGRQPDPNAAIDTSTKASGAGALKFTEPSSCGEGCAGTFVIPFTDNHAFTVGPGQDVYIQWRQRFDTNFLTNFYGPNADGFKQMILADSTMAACSDNEIVMQNTGGRGFPQMYHSCGFKDGQYEPLNVYNSPANPGQYELQNGIQNPSCLWLSNGGPYGPPCTMYKAGQWMTLQVHVHVGTWYTNNRIYHHDSIVQMWVGYEGQPSVLAIDFSPSSGDQGGYDLANSPPFNPYEYIWFLPYRTGADGTFTHPPASTWYDELIVATNKIADPGGATPPPSACDVNKDGIVNVADVQLEVNMALGLSPCTNSSGACTVVSVQRVVNAVLGGTCVAP